MDCFVCEVTEEDLILKEHEAARWLTKEQLRSVNWLPADVLILDAVEALLQQEALQESNRKQFYGLAKVKGGNKMQEPSFMIILPGDPKDIETPETIMNNLELISLEKIDS